MVLDRTLLALQILILSCLVYLELRKRGGRNLIAMVLFGSSLVLVQFQAWYMLNDLENQEVVLYLWNEISRAGFSLANLLVTLSVVTIALMYVTGSSKALRFAAGSSRGRPDRVLAGNPLVYVTVASVVVVAAASIFHLLGGLQAALQSPGRMVGGQTFLLVLLLLGKMPLLHKMATGSKPNGMDWGLMLVSGAVVLINSRFLAIYMVAQYLILRNYCFREIERRRFVLAGILGAGILLGYGGLRDYLGHFTTYGLNTPDAFGAFLGDVVSGRFDVVYFFYRVNVEGFSGLAGIITAYIENGGIAHDFGLYNLSLLTQLLPSAIRSALFGDVAAYLASLYPYSGSVVPPGYENAFAHWGFWGIGLFSLLLGLFPRWVHARLTAAGSDKLVYGVFAVHGLTLIRGTFRDFLFFVLADLALVVIYRLILTACASRSLLSGGAQETVSGTRVARPMDAHDAA